MLDIKTRVMLNMTHEGRHKSLVEKYCIYWQTEKDNKINDKIRENKIFNFII
jgi:hypothetical protein